MTLSTEARQAVDWRIRAATLFPDMPILATADYITRGDQAVLEIAYKALLAQTDEILPAKHGNIYKIEKRCFTSDPEINLPTGDFPDYTLAVSQKALAHKEAANARHYVDILSRTTNPWADLKPYALQLVNQFGFDHLPPVVIILATETEFPGNKNFRHGRYISTVPRSIRVGKITAAEDMPFVLVWGERVWSQKYHFVPEQAVTTIKHELTHLLTSLALVGETALAGTHLRGNLPVKQCLSWPLWEALAWHGANSPEFAAKQEAEIARGLAPLSWEQSSLMQTIRFNRKLANIPEYLNTLLWGITLRILQGEKINEMKFDGPGSQAAAFTFIHNCFGHACKIPRKTNDGWSARKIFAEFGLNLDAILEEIKSLDVSTYSAYIAPLKNNGLSPETFNYFKNLYPSISRWEPLGIDSFKI